MCGIIGYVGSADCTAILLDGLSKLEYRGYDSAGVAVITPTGLETRRAEGKLRNLVRAVDDAPLVGQVGVGHTRWATHGAPSEANAHPHRVGSVAVVHNGIIENHLALKAELIAEGSIFTSETDTEIIAHLVAKHRDAGRDLPAAVREAAKALRGAYAIVVVDASDPDRIVGVREASPMRIMRKTRR